MELGIVSWDFYENVQYFKALDPVWFSDNCPIEMSVKIEKPISVTAINRAEFIDLEESFL